MVYYRLQNLIRLRLRKEGYFNDETLSEFIMVMLGQNESQDTILNQLKEFLEPQAANRFTHWLLGTVEEWKIHDLYESLSSGFHSTGKDHLVKSNKKYKPFQETSLKDRNISLESMMTERIVKFGKRSRDFEWNEDDHVMQLKDNMLKIVINGVGLIYTCSDTSLPNEKRIKLMDAINIIDRDISIKTSPVLVNTIFNT
jgi:hypothetical protein